ncbi:hypothetical protein HMPREF1624_06089 [Sporothrix schenckii ATCC 58251]|uniref:Uncharacterized protein n=1 Tax=Sporothrix schenckii (strain ATCC 58251 / de Perez 2211183) TaxID=1391915 RepID=U7PQM1_SPOS1|nr:hypothetical protein HMPREF1624_06089 [Sporothrix schenckii ATCC 58251]
MAPGALSIDGEFSKEEVTAAVTFNEAAGWQLKPGRDDKGAPCLRCVARSGQDITVKYPCIPSDLRGLCQLVWNSQQDLRSKYDAYKNQSGTITSEAKAKELALLYAKILLASDTLRHEYKSEVKDLLKQTRLVSKSTPTQEWTDAGRALARLKNNSAPCDNSRRFVQGFMNGTFGVYDVPRSSHSQWEGDSGRSARSGCAVPS